ncbi:uncharacterized protein YbjQ (UPF0145 family) [Sphingomonas leidyi]|uniref:Uncharacterized protein YbjQ (UPF0145 family) n=1 Tax=Sphingomonas leidyi TaxID=68569 RepID=A0A7X5V216_9SPHN|nr:heavy metal-binding domain-containing protein [Sphingomonas leidyi]NIJ66459.1 uncharacterized protein YbjQ (UPF0145 family) [Sphingomonas leidyi]
MKFTRLSALAAVAVLVASPSLVSAQDKSKGKAEKHYVVVNEDVGVPVFATDITDRPYKVLGEVKAGVRKATIFSKEASQTKIYRELWERAEKMGADAVINAKYGDSHVSALSWGKTNATGTAIKFLAPGEATAAK